MRRVLAFLFCLLAAPSWALSPAQEIILLGGSGQSYYASPAATGIVPSWLSYASAGVRYYFDASGNLQTSPNNLLLNSAGVSSFTSNGAITVNNANSVTWMGGSSGSLTQLISSTVGQSFIFSGTFSGTPGAVISLQLVDNGSGYPVTAIPITLSSTPTRSFVAHTTTIGSSVYAKLDYNSAPSVTASISNLMVEQVTAAQTTPSAFMPTGGSAYYGPVVNDYNPSTLAALGLRSEPQRTNYVPNSTMQGAAVGSPGTLPTNWAGCGVNGVTSNVAAIGTEAGMQTIDITMSGTATASGQCTVSFGTSTGIAAAPSQTWSESVYTRQTSGSTTNISGEGVELVFFNSSLTFIGNCASSFSNLAASTVAGGRTQCTATTPAGTAYVRPVVYLNIAGAGAVSQTLRIAIPTAEQNAFATSPMLTYGAAVTVPADSWFFTRAPLAALQAPATCHVVEFTPEGAYPTINPLIKSNTTGSFGSAFTPSSTQVALANVTQVAVVSTAPSAGVLNRVAAAGAPGAYAVAANGVLGTGNYAGAQTPGSAYGLGSANFYGWFSQILIKPPCTATQVKAYSTANSNMSH